MNSIQFAKASLGVLAYQHFEDVLQFLCQNVFNRFLPLVTSDPIMNNTFRKFGHIVFITSINRLLPIDMVLGYTMAVFIHFIKDEREMNLHRH